MKLDDFHLLELLRNGDLRKSIGFVATHFGLKEDMWEEIPIHQYFTKGIYSLNSMRLSYPYCIKLTIPGRYWEWHSVYGWENHMSTSLFHTATVGLPFSA